jgi:hypothetical protein
VPHFVEFAGVAARRLARLYHLTSGYALIDRLQAARHSTLLMCVAASQKAMQSASVLPPPPGLRGADWLGLPLPEEASGERASEGPPEEPAAVPNWLGKGSDIGHSGDTFDPGCAVVGAVGVVVAATPPGGVSPADGVGDNGVGDNDVDGAADVVTPGDTLGVMVGKIVGGAESLGLGVVIAPPVDERACANATSGRSSKRPMAARTGGLDVNIAITIVLPAVPQRLATNPNAQNRNKP